MRLLAGVLASCPFRSVLVGDESLSARPMDRIAVPLQGMGAAVETTAGRPPLRIDGGRLRGIRYAVPVPSAQVKSAVLLAGTAAEGRTVVEESVRTRDHTEVVLAALGAPLAIGEGTVSISAFQHGALAGRVPGDPSSAAFLVAAAVVTGSGLTIEGVGLNPTRLGFVEVLRRMGVVIDTTVRRRELGELVGDIAVSPIDELRATEVTEEELPLVIDEVPVLAAVAAHARGDTWFEGAGELRVKETDRLHAIVDGLRGLGGSAGVEGEGLVVSGAGLRGGSASARGDHRMAMALAVAGLGADGRCLIDGMEHAEVSYPGFVATLRALGAPVELDP
jgi:3-phosphoshikimate 1-carboxyvinyltransferase